MLSKNQVFKKIKFNYYYLVGTGGNTSLETLFASSTVLLTVGEFAYIL